MAALTCRKQARLDTSGVLSSDGLLGPLDEALLMQHVVPLLSADDKVRLRGVSPALCKVLDAAQVALKVKLALLQQALVLERCERLAHPSATVAAGSNSKDFAGCSTAPAAGLQNPYRTLAALARWRSIITFDASSSLPPGFVPLLVACGVEGGQMDMVQHLVTKLEWHAQMLDPGLACCSPQFMSRGELVCNSAMLGYMPLDMAVQQLRTLTSCVGLTAAPDCKQLWAAVAPLCQLATLLLYRRQFDHVEAIAQLLPPRSVTMAKVAVPLACALLLVGQPERAARTCLRYLPAPCGQDSIAMRIACALAEQPAPDMSLVKDLEVHALGTSTTSYHSYPPEQVEAEQGAFVACSAVANNLQTWDKAMLDISTQDAKPLSAGSPDDGLDSYAPPMASPAVAHAFRNQPVESLVTGTERSYTQARSSLPTCLAAISAHLRGSEQLSALQAPLAGLGPYAVGFVRRQLLPSLGITAATALAPSDARLLQLQQLRKAVAAAAGGSVAAVAQELALAEASALLMGGHAEEAAQAAAGCDRWAWGYAFLQAFGAGGSAAAASFPRAMPAALAVMRRVLPLVPDRGGHALSWLTQQHAAAAAASPSEGEHALAYAAACLSGVPCIEPEDLATKVIAPLVDAGQWRAALKFIQGAPALLQQGKSSLSSRKAAAAAFLGGSYLPLARAAAAEVVDSGPSSEAGSAIALYLESVSGPGHTDPSDPDDAADTPAKGDLLEALKACVVARMALVWQQRPGGEDSRTQAAGGKDSSMHAAGGGASQDEPGCFAAAQALIESFQSQPDEALAHQLWVLLVGHSEVAEKESDVHFEKPVVIAFNRWQELKDAVLGEPSGCALEGLLACALPLALHVVQNEPPSARLAAFAALAAVEGLALPWLTLTLPGDIATAALQVLGSKPELRWLVSLFVHSLVIAWVWSWGAPDHAAAEEGEEQGSEEGATEVEEQRRALLERVLQAQGHTLVPNDVRWNDNTQILKRTVRELAHCHSAASVRVLLRALAAGVTVQAVLGVPEPITVGALLLEAACAEVACKAELAGLCGEVYRTCYGPQRRWASAIVNSISWQVHDAANAALAGISALDALAPRVLWHEVRQVIDTAINGCAQEAAGSGGLGSGSVDVSTSSSDGEDGEDGDGADSDGGAIDAGYA